MAPPFPEVPVDILYLIFYQLDVLDLAQVSATCRVFRDIVKERTIWSEKIKDIRTRLPFLYRDRPNLLNSSTEKLKKEGIRQTVLDHRWIKQELEPVPFTQLDCGDNVGFFTIFPGGEYIVVIFRDGRFTLRKLDDSTDDSPPRSVTVQFPEHAVHGIMHNFWTLRSTDGSAVLSMSQYLGSYSCMNFYRICPGAMTIELLGRKLLPLCRWTSTIRRIHPEEENMLACLHVGTEPEHMQISILLLSNSSPSSSQPFSCDLKATFDLGTFTPTTDAGLELELFSLCIPFSHLTIITQGSCHIRVYEHPPLETLETLVINERDIHPVAIPVIWHWITEYRPVQFEPTLLFPHIPCQRASLQQSSYRLVHITAEDSLSLHCLSIIVTKGVNGHLRTMFKHRLHNREMREEVVGNSYLALRSYRGAWSRSVEDRLTFETMAFHGDSTQGDADGEEPLPIGSFWIDTGLSSPYLVDWDFEEVSGRFCLLVMSNSDSEHPPTYVYLVDRGRIRTME